MDTISTFSDEGLAAPPIYTCSLCDKPYTNEFSRNRHIKYCQTRTYNRPRSCRACNSAKSKCSFESPCSRCSKKGIKCVYEPGKGARKATTRQVSSDETAMPPAVVMGVNETATNHENLLGGYDQSMDLVQPQIFENYEWGMGDPASSKTFTDSFDIDGLLAFDDYPQGQIGCLVEVPQNPYEKFGPEPGLWCKWASYGLSLAVVTENTTIKASSKVSDSVQRINSQANRTADLIIQALRAFPTMMLRRETFPWFIHTQSHLLTKSRINLPDAITSCMSIAQMFSSKTTETEQFLWKSMMLEYRRLTNDMWQMSKYELLAALQACMIYLIICIVDHSPESEDHGLQLLQVLYEIFIHFKNRFDAQGSDNENTDSSSDWESWIFAESRRRLQNLWLLVGCVVCVKTGNPCDTSESYRGVPLPSPKSLWEASTQSSWETLYDTRRLLKLNGLENLGDLIDVQRSDSSPSNARKLDLWNASVDNLGLLLNLVTTMV